jgi:Fe-S-cluster containining protein
MSTPLCQGCGACCCNAAENVAAGVRTYVEIDDPRSRLLTRADLRNRYVTEIDGAPYLRLDGAGEVQRCAALRGKLGFSVSCVVYTHRPAPCRRVEPGDRECLRARAERGLG